MNNMPKLRMPAPPDRNVEQLWHHYLVEKEIASKLKSATREERKTIYCTMYNELFSRVPDHPRLTRRESEAQTQKAIQAQMAFVHEFLSPSYVFAEFAAGDCRFSMEIAAHCKKVYAIDISDQRGMTDCPKNFELIIYDGYDLNLEDASVDLVYSNQLIEHFHPEDTELHFRLVNRVLKKGGKYVFRTPHAYTGPHDISKYFSEHPDGFHLKEWTYHEIWGILKKTGFSFCSAVRYSRRRKVPFIILLSLEFLSNLSPQPIKRKILNRFGFRDGITIMARK